jgi:hypothetical protein
MRDPKDAEHNRKIWNLFATIEFFYRKIETRI